LWFTDFDTYGNYGNLSRPAVDSGDFGNCRRSRLMAFGFAVGFVFGFS